MIVAKIQPHTAVRALLGAHRAGASPNLASTRWLGAAALCASSSVHVADGRGSASIATGGRGKNDPTRRAVLTRAAGEDALAAGGAAGDPSADVADAVASSSSPGASSPPGASSTSTPSSSSSLAAAASAALGAAGRAAAAPYAAYGRALKSRPLLTKACTSFLGFMVGDAIAQSLSLSAAAAASSTAPAAPAALDCARVLRLGLFGLCVDGPLGAKWYDWLEANVCPSRPRSLRAVLAKTALDQVVYASVGTVLFFAAITCLEGRPEAAPAVVAAKWLPTMLANYAVWPLAHLVSFGLVSPAYRVLYNNVVSVGWLSLLSLIAHTQAHAMGPAQLLAYIAALLSRQ